ncbi:MAG: diguanylate cyclase [Lachnospiraceae bacterium]|nr:diguanylate cyclase [Lachnospiraceae bacterium]
MRKNWIVVVDDDVIVLKNINNLLGGEDMNVSSVRSGRELLVFMKKNNPDLILLDVMMPEMDGFETFKKIREFEDSEGRGHVPVIFLTGDDDSEIEMKGLKIGASDFVRKPVNKDILVTRIRNIISSRKAIENLTEEAMTDSLTGFYNKAYVDSNMEELCSKSKGSLMVLDLDNFKPINDIYGHDVGDEFLKSFTRLVKEYCDNDDVFCRIGGDEFLVLTKQERNKESMSAFTSKMNARIIEECVKLTGKDFNVPIGVSIGAISVSNEGDYDRLFKLADKALFRVKQNGKHGYRIYSEETQNDNSEVISAKKALDRMTILCDERGKLEKAMVVGQDSFISIYQFMKRFALRHRTTFTRLVFSISTDEGIDKDDVMVAFGEVLKKSLRKNDVVMKDNTDCYYLILPEPEDRDVTSVVGRIMDNWKKTIYSDCTDVDYSFEVVGDDE